MRRFALTASFDGTHFAGWQVQHRRAALRVGKSRHPTSSGPRTVQGTIEDTLARIARKPVIVSGCSRIDAGAHARKHVSHFDIETRMGEADLVRALNALFPEDIVVLALKEVDSQFHARKSAVSKSYEYVVWNQDTRPLWERDYAWHVPGELDLAAMREAASLLIGRANFAAFKNAGSSVKTTVRNLTEAVIHGGDGKLIFRFSADGFLKQMVRIMVGTLMEIGRGKRSSGDIEDLLKSGDRDRAGRTAPARGLFLTEVQYPGEEFA